jgi:hypothetical protein
LPIAICLGFAVGFGFGFGFAVGGFGQLLFANCFFTA